MKRILLGLAMIAAFSMVATGCFDLDGESGRPIGTMLICSSLEGVSMPDLPPILGFGISHQSTKMAYRYNEYGFHNIDYPGAHYYGWRSFYKEESGQFCATLNPTQYDDMSHGGLVTFEEFERSYLTDLYIDDPANPGLRGLIDLRLDSCDFKGGVLSLRVSPDRSKPVPEGKYSNFAPGLIGDLCVDSN